MVSWTHWAGRSAGGGSPVVAGRVEPRAERTAHPGKPGAPETLRGGPLRDGPAAPRAADRRSWPGAFITAKPDDGDAHPPQSPRSDQSQPRCRRPPLPDERSRTRETRCPTRRGGRPTARSADSGQGRPQRRSRRRGRRTRASVGTTRAAQRSPRPNATPRRGGKARSLVGLRKSNGAGGPAPGTGRRAPCGPSHASMPTGRVRASAREPKKMAEKTRFQREPKWR